MHSLVCVSIRETHELLAAHPHACSNQLCAPSLKRFSSLLPDGLLHRLIDDWSEATSKLGSAERAAHAFLQNCSLTLEAEEVVAGSDNWLHAELVANRALIIIVADSSSFILIVR